MDTPKKTPLWRRLSATLVVGAFCALIGAELPAIASYRDSFSTSQLPALNGDCQSAAGTATLSCPDQTTIVTTGTSYQASATDRFICVKLGTAATFTVTLPVAPITGRPIKVKDCGRTASMATPINVVASSGNVDSATSFPMTNTGQGDIFEFDGSQFETF